MEIYVFMDIWILMLRASAICIYRLMAWNKFAFSLKWLLRRVVSPFSIDWMLTTPDPNWTLSVALTSLTNKNSIWLPYGILIGQRRSTCHIMACCSLSSWWDENELLVPIDLLHCFLLLPFCFTFDILLLAVSFPLFIPVITWQLYCHNFFHLLSNKYCCCALVASFCWHPWCPPWHYLLHQEFRQPIPVWQNCQIWGPFRTWLTIVFRASDFGKIYCFLEQFIKELPVSDLIQLFSWQSSSYLLNSYFNFFSVGLLLSLASVLL